ncbi:MAG: adenylate/guanylate cyclase domain-containing protein [Deltaproteobacteria bacterium]|nr:adenylate/guanylate cyclase domain-containing protein [Deltaproteobacteria bacterium]
MSAVSYRCRTDRVLPAPPGLVYALMSDTNRWDRVVGFKRSTYEYQLVADSRVQVGHARMMGLEVSWLEIGEGVEGSWMLAERRFLAGPVERAGYRFQVTPAPGGTRLEVESYVLGSPLLPPEAGELLRQRAEAGMQRYVDALQRILGSAPPGAAEGDEPVFAWGRRWLSSAPPDAVFSGPSAAVDEAALAFCAARLAAAPVDAAVRERLLTLLRTRPDEELRQLRPYELARAWALPPREVLRGFLHAARVGLFDLRWQLDCPTCRVGAGVARSLEEVARTQHCADCDVAFDLDFADNVEATFTVNDSVRKVEAQVFCGASPWHRPHIFAGARLEPGEDRVVELPLPPGRIAIRVARRRVVLQGRPAALEVTVGDQSLSVDDTGAAPAGGPCQLRLHNPTRVPVTVLVERADFHPDMVPGTELATFPEFLDLFSAEAPAVGLDLTVSTLTVLFSDLTASTAIYRRIGDARAFALVQRHFHEVGALVAAREGAVVKTMGDAVMAAFRSPAGALRAGLEVVQRVRALALEQGLPELAARVGVNQGACLAVRANGRLDFFGTTVNLAARLQGHAAAHEVVVPAELAARAEVARVIAEVGAQQRSQVARLKGFAEELTLVALTQAG